MSVIENVPQIDFNKHLECPVCLDFAASPIHTCRNGHLVCGICEEKTKICPTCQADNLLVNHFVERVLKAEGVVVPCRNSQHGCTLLVPPSEMKAHLKDSCDFRPIKCQELDLCDQQSYHPKELFKHWVDFHDIVQANLTLPSSSNNLQKGLMGTTTIRLTLTAEEYEKEVQIDAECSSWAMTYVEINGRTFMFHCTTEEGIFIACMTLLGMESDATQYRFTGTFSSCQLKAERRIIFNMIPVHSLQYYFTKKVDELGHTAAIPLQNLKLIQDEKPSCPELFLEWKVRFDIFGFEDRRNSMELDLIGFNVINALNPLNPVF